MPAPTTQQLHNLRLHEPAVDDFNNIEDLTNFDLEMEDIMAMLFEYFWPRAVTLDEQLDLIKLVQHFPER